MASRGAEHSWFATANQQSKRRLKRSFTHSERRRKMIVVAGGRVCSTWDQQHMFCCGGPLGGPGQALPRHNVPVLRVSI